MTTTFRPLSVLATNGTNGMMMPMVDMRRMCA
ncbi:hypothetical protein J2X49_002470 [Agrococcus sp. BE272]|nr:hypothetical protein [Agrococcus sp. BE272]